MRFTLPSFAAAVRDILQRDNSPTGRAQVAELLATALKDRLFVDSVLDDNTPERKIVHEDPQLGFCILAHRYTDARDGGPHDHGPSWAIYGQADGETVMSDWEVVEPATSGQRAKVKKVREYTLTPGVAHLYNEGEIHSPSRSGASRLVRIEGVNLETVRRGSYQPA